MTLAFRDRDTRALVTTVYRNGTLRLFTVRHTAPPAALVPYHPVVAAQCAVGA